ncbi:MAG: hypothetical protein RIR70_2074 [Pseudomonadota bacterium]|jgi:hypothetical protein
MAEKEHLLLRQVNPAWVQNGRISSQTFTPTPKDDRLLSVDDGRLVEPEQSHAHFTGTRGLKSMGVVAVANLEVAEAGLAWRPDPLPDSATHAVIDFSQLVSNGQIKAKASWLAEKARARGWLFQPPAEEPV